MKVLVVGSGGREHALAWKCAASPRVSEVLVAPGNAGTSLEPGVRNVTVAATDIAGLADLAASEQVGLTIVGPEAPLAAGIVDELRSRSLPCFGPTRAAAQLEASKAFAKAFLVRHGIPTARSTTFTASTFDPAYVRSQRTPLVVKASGLAAGKGVVIAATADEAIATAQGMLAGSLGDAGQEVLIEEFLEGEEASFIVMTDGTHVLPLATAQDHKRRDDGDLGPNTGGMGAYSPAPIITPTLHAHIMREIIVPAIRGLAAEGTPYLGFLYAGLMISPDGTPLVLEFNCRLGDPEAQPILMRLTSDLTVLCEAALAGRLDTVQAHWDERAALAVVMAAAGYPGDLRRGDAISGLDAAAHLSGKVFHGGTQLAHGTPVTSGGRVLTATACGRTVTDAQHAAYRLVEAIRWPGALYRRDIGYRAVAREQGA
jgi:phosphoribosylamine--glycine ligase